MLCTSHCHELHAVVSSRIRSLNAAQSATPESEAAVLGLETRRIRSRTRHSNSSCFISSYRNAIQDGTITIPELAGALRNWQNAIPADMAFVPCRRRDENWVSGQVKETKMARKSKRQRLEEQRERQATVRAEAKANKKPGRDDFARVLLWQAIIKAQRQQDGGRKLDRLRDMMTDVLEKQGFNLKEAEDVFHELARKYATGLNPFRPKSHMVFPTD